jgi:hypothetical protein
MCGCTQSTQYGANAVNPLSGTPLTANQALVFGPDYTGPRKTVVNLTDPQSWPSWIRSLDGQPHDDGSIAGGTWSGPQQLATLATTARRSWWWLILAVVVALLVVRAAK